MVNVYLHHDACFRNLDSLRIMAINFDYDQNIDGEPHNKTLNAVHDSIICSHFIWSALYSHIHNHQGVSNTKMDNMN